MSSLESLKGIASGQVVSLPHGTALAVSGDRQLAAGSADLKAYATAIMAHVFLMSLLRHHWVMMPVVQVRKHDGWGTGLVSQSRTLELQQRWPLLHSSHKVIAIAYGLWTFVVCSL